MFTFVIAVCVEPFADYATSFTATSVFFAFILHASFRTGRDGWLLFFCNTVRPQSHIPFMDPVGRPSVHVLQSFHMLIGDPALKGGYDACFAIPIRLWSYLSIIEPVLCHLCIFCIHSAC